MRMRTGRPPFQISILIIIFVNTLTESSKRGTLLYIDKSLKYKLRKDLKLNKPKQIGSSFIEIIKTAKKNTVIGCIYKHLKFQL